MKKLFFILISAGLITACHSNKNKGPNKGVMNHEKMQRFYDEVMNAHNPAAIDSFVTADFIDHQADPRYPKGAEGLKAAFKDFFAGYPDLHVTTNFIVVRGDTVIAQTTTTGTNSGPNMGMPATNKKINMDGVDIVVIKDGKATEHWGFFEEMKMMTQLGLMPGPNASTDSSMMNKEPMQKK